MTKEQLIITIEGYIEQNIDTIQTRGKNNATILFCLETVLQTSIDALNRCNISELK